ncbi:MAG: transglycosylase family protein, partial [Acidimicrobiales bacterium]
MQSADRPPPIDAVPIVPSTVAELESSVPIEELHGTVAPRTGISPLARHSGPAPSFDPPVERTERLEDGARLERSSVSHRFEYRSADDELRPGASSPGRRLVQGAVVLALIAAAGALLWVLPESEDSLFAAGKPTGRVEATEKPAATSELASGADRPEVEGSLRLLAASGRLSKNGLDRAPSVVAGDERREDYAAAAAVAVDDGAVDEPKQPATTARPEPTIGPERDWVDSGNGVAVPDLLLRIRFCESTNNYSATNPGSTASGAYQFLDKSWDWYGHAARTGVSRAHLATRAQQDQAALSTLQAQGTAPWAASRSCWTNENIDPRYATASRPPARSTTTAPTTTTTGTSETTT